MTGPNFGSGKPDPRNIAFGENGAEHAIEVLDANFPEIVCLSGSTRFKYEFRETNAYLTLQGKIVLSVGFFHHADGGPPGRASELVEEVTDEDGEWKQELDHLHFRKIDLADRVHVINADGYVGESTENEIKYAIRKGKRITWREPDNRPDWFLEVA